jgi:hypothetical protein
MAAKPKAKPRSAKGGTERYDNKLYRKFEDDRDSAPEDRDFMREFHYRAAIWRQASIPMATLAR